MRAMPKKRVPYRFTIGFSPGDPAHQVVAGLLTQQGRRKAQFLVNAVLHYIHCPESPKTPEMQAAPAQVDLNGIAEQIVGILKDQGYCKATASPWNTGRCGNGGHIRFPGGVPWKVRKCYQVAPRRIVPARRFLAHCALRYIKVTICALVQSLAGPN